MEQAIKSIVNETTVYSTLSHYLFDKIIEDQSTDYGFHFFSIYSWLQIGSMIASVLALLISIYLFCRTKAFLSVAVVANRATARPTRPPGLRDPLVYPTRPRPTFPEFIQPNNMSYTQISNQTDKYRGLVSPPL